MKLAVACLAVAFLGQPLLAQSSQTAEISGRIEDSQGAVIAGAAISIKNNDTGVERATTSDDRGAYDVTNLIPGPYRLEVSKSGFGSYAQTGIVLQVNTNPSIVVTLQVGSVQQQVEVVGNQPLVETHNQGVGTLVDPETIVDMPLNNRQVTQLVVLSGAAVNAATLSNGQSLISNKNYPTASAFSIAGGQAGQTLFVLDGAYNMDPTSNVGLPYPFPDALLEFKVETSSLPANYGSQPGGFVNVLTRSGTNRFHGGVFEFLRNYDFDARNYFAANRDTLKRNQFGGYLGGPILKDKLFFFGGYQGTRESSPFSNIAYVETAASLQGDFTALASPACNNGRQITLKAPYANNMVAKAQLNPVAVNLLALIPVSTDPCGKLTYTTPSTDQENQEVGKVDYNFSSKQSFSARYFITQYTHAPYYAGNLLTLSQNASAGLQDRVQSGVLSHTYIFSPKIVSSTKISASRNYTFRYMPSNAPTITQLGAAVTQQEPNFLSVSVGSNFGVACPNCADAYYVSTNFQVASDFTMDFGKQQILVGGDTIHSLFDGRGGFQSNGVISVNGQITGLALADLEVGGISSILQSNGQILHEGVNIPSFYVQDNIRFSPRFTVNVGFRWDPYLLPYNNDHTESIFDPGWYAAGIHSKMFPNAPAGTLFYGDAGTPGSGYGFGKIANFAPRVGFILDPRGSGEESIRAGYGIFYGATPLYLQLGTHAPYSTPINVPQPAGGLSNPWATYPGGNPFPTPATFGPNTTFSPFGGGLGSFKLHPQPTSIQQWSLSIQKQLPGNWLASVSYLGNRSLHLERGLNYDPVQYIPGNCVAGQYGLTAAGPCSTAGNENYRTSFYINNPSQGQYYGGESVFSDDAVSNYNGLLISVQHSLARHFTVLTNYTYSHCLGESDIALNGAAAPQNPYNESLEYGNCISDERQIFNLSITATSPRFKSRLTTLLASGWQIAPLFTAHTGNYSTVTDGSDNTLIGTTARPNQIGNGKLSNPTINHWFNTAAFAVAGPGNFGNTQRNTIVGPNIKNLDLAVSRQFPVRREQGLLIRVEAFNALNNTQFLNPNTTLNSSQFGVITTARDPRILQVAAKYTF